MYARGNFPALRSRARHGISAQGPARLSSRLHCRQPRRRPAARRRRHPQAGQRQCRRTNALRTQGAGFAIWVIVIDVAKGWIAAAVLPGLALPGVPPRAGDPGRVAAGGCAPSPPSSATCFRSGMAFAAARVWPRWWARSPASSSLLLLPLFASWLGVVMVSGFVGLASIIAALAIPVYLLMRDGAVLSPVHGVRAGLRGAGHLHASRQRAAHARRHRAARAPAVAVRARPHVNATRVARPLAAARVPAARRPGVPVGRSAGRGSVGDARRRVEGGGAIARARRGARCADQQGLSARAGRQRAVGGAHPGAAARRGARAHRSACWWNGRSSPPTRSC